MFRSSLWAVVVTFTTLAAVSSVYAVPMIDSSNSTQALLSDAPSHNNPFQGLSLDVRSNSFSKTVLDRSVSEAEIDRRQVAQVVKVVAKLITMIVEKVKAAIERDKKARGRFTQYVVDEGRKSHPQFNWVVCHTKHRTKFKGVQGKDWDHEHKEFDVKIGGTIGYEVYYVREGEFWNDGDGGYLNWAYNGFFTHDGKGNKHVVFTKPPGT